MSATFPREAVVESKIKVKLLDKNAILPTKANPTDAGFDLYSVEEGTIYPNSVTVIGTGVSMAIPTGFFGLIKPRSGMSFKNGVSALAGVIDSDFRGEIKVILTSESEIRYKVGARVAQIVIIPIPSFSMVEAVDLSETNRGEGGFGSSGK